MQTFGDYLKREREARKVSLREVAHLTNITERYLDFIEKDDYAKLPEGPYVRGYISSYAKSIGINTHEALDRFDLQCRERNKAKDIQQEILEDKIRQKPKAFSLNKGKWLLLCSTIMVFLTFGVYYWLSQDEKKALVVANLQGPEGKGLQTTLAMKSEGNVPPLTMNDHSMSSSKPEGLQKDVEHHSSDQIVLKKKPSVQRRKTPGPTRTFLGVASGEQTGDARSDHEKTIEVLKAAVCTDVKDRKPSGENDSFQWSMDRIYIWNLIKCESHLSSIRHIYYF